jgi:hypothetical protein
MLRRLALVRTDVSGERIISIIRVTRIGVLQLLITVNFVPSSSPILVPQMMEAIHSSEASDFTRATRRNDTKICILQEISFLSSNRAVP